jgi:hypothetical protein
VLERVLAELSMLQASAHCQTGVAPLQLSQLNALIAQVRSSALHKSVPMLMHASLWIIGHANLGLAVRCSTVQLACMMYN